MNGIENISNENLTTEDIPLHIKKWKQINEFALSFDVNNYYKKIDETGKTDNLSELRKELIQIQRFYHWDTYGHDEALSKALPIIEQIREIINE